MTALVLDPHGDDAALFCAFSALATSATVIGVLRSQVQEDRYGIDYIQREAETDAAMQELGLEWHQWPYLDDDPSWPQVQRALEILDAGAVEPYDPVFAPAIEQDGHDHHSKIGALALQVFGARVVPYLTYTRSGGRSREGTEIVPEPDWIARKHRALACFRSQIEEPSCRPWFLGDLREYVA